MEKWVLPNGITVLYHKKEGKSVVIQVMVKVGSNHENKQERGIAHFLEHLLFEGTTKRPDNRMLSNEIERIGGEFNAYTTYERTCFYIEVLHKHFAIATEVLADILHNSLFKEEHITKEKNIVLKEIDMIYDEPRFYQWVLLQQNLFSKHPCKFPTYGDKKIIKTLTKEKVISFFHKFYTPQNIVISIVGNIPHWKKIIKEQFILKRAETKKISFPPEPPAAKTKTILKKAKITNTYTVMGFKTVPRSHRDSYVLDVINAITGRGQSGRMFTEIRSKLGLAYDVGTQHVCEVNFGFFAVYATIDKKNQRLIKEKILSELKYLHNVSDQDIKEAKDFIEGSFLLELENAQKVADQLLYWEQVKDASFLKGYIKNIKNVTIKEVRAVVEKYFRSPTIIILEGK